MRAWGLGAGAEKAARLAAVASARKTGAPPESLKLLCIHALEVVDRASPADWAFVHDCLGLAESDVGGADAMARAIAAWENVLEVRERAADPESWARTHHNLAAAYADSSLGRTLELLGMAAGHLEAALSVRTGEHHPTECAHSEQALAGILALIDQEQLRSGCVLRSRLDLLSRSVRLAHPEMNPNLFAQLSVRLAGVLLAQSGPTGESADLAIAALKWAAARLDAVDASHAAGVVLSELGTTYREHPACSDLDRVENALQAHTESLARISRAVAPREWANCQANLGKCYADRVGLDHGFFAPFSVGPGDEPGCVTLTMESNIIHNQKLAIQAYQEALSVFRHRSDPEAWAAVVADLATVYAVRVVGNPQHNVDRAIRLLHAALSVVDPASSPHVFGHAAANLGRAYAKRRTGEREENLRRASAWLAESLRVRGHEQDALEWALRQISRAGIMQLRAQVDETELHPVIVALREVLGILSPTGPLRARISALCIVAWAYTCLERLDEAYEALVSARALEERLIESAVTYEAKNAAIVESEATRGQLVELCLRRGQVAEALEQVDHGRARLLLRQVADLPRARPPNVPASLLEEEQDLLERHRRAQCLVSLAPDSKTRQHAAETTSRVLDRLRLLWQQMEEYAADAYVRRRAGIPLGWGETRDLVRHLSPGALIVTLWSANQRTCAFIGAPEWDEPRLLELPSIKELSRAAHALAAWDDVSADQQHSASDAWRREGRQFADLLRPYLESARRVWIIPGSEHYHIPWHALECHAGALVECCPISYAPSLSIGLDDRGRSPESYDDVFRQAAVIGDPTGDLEGARFEAIMVASRIGGGVEPMIGGKATRQAVLDALRVARAGHFACHGTFSELIPLAASLELADGALRAWELYEEGFDLAFAALSACASGRVRASRGDEVSGLVRALMGAGTSRVLATHWNVGDEVGEWFMHVYYGVLAEQTGPPDYAQAWQRSSLETRKRWPEPYAWAPFVLFEPLI